MQGFEIRIRGREGVGVRAVGVQYQRAVSTGKRAGGDRAGILSNSNSVGALHVVGQHVAVEGQLGFRGSAIAIVNRIGHVIGDVDVQGTGDAVPVAVASHHGELFTDAIGALNARMGFAAVEGIAVTDHARGGVVSGDCQGAAQQRGDRLREAGGHTTADHVDPADTQTAQAIGCRNSERAVLRQRTGVPGGTVGQIGFVDSQLAARHR